MTLFPDGPVALCTVMHPEQHLAIANKTGAFHGHAHPARIEAGGLPHLTIQPGHTTRFDKPIGAYFAQGQHRVYYADDASAFYIWVK